MAPGLPVLRDPPGVQQEGYSSNDYLMELEPDVAYFPVDVLVMEWRYFRKYHVFNLVLLPHSHEEGDQSLVTLIKPLQLLEVRDVLK